MLMLAVLLPCLMKIASSTFDPEWDSFDAFGMKLAANDYVIAAARNDFSQFVLQFGPFDVNNISQPCKIDYPGLSTGDINFIYNIAVGKQINASNTPLTTVVFAGENYNAVNSSKKGPFIGRLYNHSGMSCTMSSNIEYFATLNNHEEYSVLGVNPSGTFAYGFGRSFGVIYNLNTNTIVKSWQNDTTFWPNSSYFLPHAIDISDTNYAIVAGFDKQIATGSYLPVVHLLRMNTTSVHVTDTWIYSSINLTWQSSMKNWDADLFHSKYTMSVSIDSHSDNVLVGIQSMNTVFRFEVDDASDRLNYSSSRWNGKHLGYGKSVAWLNEGSTIVVLANQYSLQYAWISSNTYLYNRSDTTMTTVESFFPSDTMPAWDQLNPILISLVTTSNHIVTLDNNGQVYVIRSTPPGYYSVTCVDLEQNPAFSSFTPCPPGTYKTHSGFELCSLCPVGTSNSLYSLSTMCIPYSCSDTSFCPLGSIINDTYPTIMIQTSQAVAYPGAPDSDVFDDILMEHVFTLGYSSNCLAKSPIFWGLFLACIACAILITMGLLKYSTRSIRIRKKLKRFFQQVDLVNHGEFWVTGLASFSLIIILTFSYYFSYSFLHQYPTETVGDSTFTCSSQLRNAKFVSNIQPLTIPRNDEQEPVFELLDEQELILTVDFVNTIINCSHIEVQEYFHSIYHPVENNCTQDQEQYMISVSIPVTRHSGQFQYIVNDVNPIGGLRLSVTGDAKELLEEHYYAAQEVQYSQPLHSYGQTVSHNATIKLMLTKLINLTEPLQLGGVHKFVGIWLPALLSQTSDLFRHREEAETYTLSITTLSVIISESSYYVWNQQLPISRSTEIIFHNLLFTIVCLELFGLGYLISKLIFLPIFKLLRWYIEKSPFIQSKLAHSTSSEVTVPENSMEKLVWNTDNQTQDERRDQEAVSRDANQQMGNTTQEKASATKIKVHRYVRNVQGPKYARKSNNLPTYVIGKSVWD